MASSPIKTKLHDYPVYAAHFFNVLKEAGAPIVCLYGGALRDTDCSKFYDRKVPVKDYDMRVWLPEPTFKENMSAVLQNLSKAGAMVGDARWWAADKPRYSIKLLDNEIDLSFRFQPVDVFSDASAHICVAQDRVADTPVGLSAVALDNTLQAWVLPEYLEDQFNETLTVLPSEHPDRSLEYAQRLQTQKYQTHKIIIL